MSYETILYAVREGVATITLNRPEKLNAYVPEMGEEIVAAFSEAREDAEVGAVVVTGAGRGFCAGVDLERLMESRAEAEAAGTKLGEEDFLRGFPWELRDFPKPTLAAINGAAVGVGITFILPFDLRIAAAGVKLAVPFTKLGMLPGLGSTHLLPQLIGAARAKDLVMTGRTILSEEGERIGLVSQVVPGEELLETVEALARDLAKRNPLVLAAAKRALHDGEHCSMSEAMENERREGDAIRGGG
jgi:2-(1,2-epoxy-1,2-dihydrophenyl)acetyl-CoA isomerase